MKICYEMTIPTDPFQRSTYRARGEFRARPHHAPSLEDPRADGQGEDASRPRPSRKRRWRDPAAATVLPRESGRAAQRSRAASAPYREANDLCHQGTRADGCSSCRTVAWRSASVWVTATGILHATVYSRGSSESSGVLARSDRTASVLTLADSEVWAGPCRGFLAFLASEPAASR